MNVDPGASMRCWVIGVQIGDRAYDIPALPAADWWPVLAEVDPMRVLDLIPECDLDDRLLMGEIDGTELGETLTEVVETVTGRAAFTAFALARAAALHWPVINGRLVQRGFRWDVMPIGAALDAIYAVAVENMEQESREKFDALLEQQVPDGTRKPRINRAKAIADMESFAGPMPTATARASAGHAAATPPRTPQQPRPPRRRVPSGAPTEQPGPPG